MNTTSTTPAPLVPGLKANHDEAEASQVLGNEETRRATKRPATTASFATQPNMPTLAERRVLAMGYPGLFAGMEELRRRQYRFMNFFKYTSNAVDYACWLPDEPVPHVFRGDVPDKVLELADLICVQCVGRTLRPVPPGSRQPPIAEDDPKMQILRAENIKKIVNEFWAEWKDSHERDWWCMYNPVPFFAPREGQPASAQPDHMLLARSVDYARQAEMNEAKNLLAGLSFCTRLNRGLRMSRQREFRSAINGWRYSEAPDAPKAGASQAVAHWQLTRFIYPIERAPIRKRLLLGPLSVFTLVDGWGTGLVVEAHEKELETLASISTARN